MSITREKSFHLAHMNAAIGYAALSRAVRMQVGCVIVKDDSVIAYGYNGTPSGWSNDCEDQVFYEPQMSDTTASDIVTLDSIMQQYPYVTPAGARYKLVTREEVLHAEANAISKVAKSSNSSSGATMYVTCSPCVSCAKIIYQAGITSVYYMFKYRCTKGIDFLLKCGVKVEKLEVGDFSNLVDLSKLAPPI